MQWREVVMEDIIFAGFQIMEMIVCFPYLLNWILNMMLFIMPMEEVEHHPPSRNIMAQRLRWEARNQHEQVIYLKAGRQVVQQQKRPISQETIIHQIAM